MASISKKYDSIQYDGTNGSTIAGTFCTAITFVSDNGTTFVFNDGDSGEHSMNVDDWLVRQSNEDDPFPVVETTSSYALNWLSQIDPVEYTLKMAAGYALTPTILASASANVAVNLDLAMTGTSYETTAVLAGAASLLGGLQITDISITDSDTVTVTVQNTGLVSLAGATVIVAAAQLVEA